MTLMLEDWFDVHKVGFLDSKGEYSILDTCIDTIDKCLTELTSEGPLFDFRRGIGHFKTLRKCLVPLLSAATVKCHRVIPKLVKFLSWLSVPLECLTTSGMMRTEDGGHAVREVEQLLMAIKSEFADFQISKCIVTFINSIINKVDVLSDEESESVSDGLLLLRNILHIPHPELQLQNQILWNLFSHSIDKILIHLMTCEQKVNWSVTLVQLIALIYKDQHVQHLKKFLNLWLENSMSESSEDNESNTSPKEHEEFCDGDSSSPMLTSSDPTNSDSSDGDKEKVTSGDSGQIQRQQIPTPAALLPSGHAQQKCYSKSSKSKNEKRKEKQSDADSGILSITNTNDGKNMDDSKEECTSTSTNEVDPVVTAPRPMSINKKEPRNVKQSIGQHAHTKMSQKHLRVPSMKGAPPLTVDRQDSYELKRKKLHKRSKKGRKNMKSLVHHNPTEDDIALILSEFTVDFLLKGYASLVSLLHQRLCTNATVEMDKSHFLWLITYFLKFATELELDLEHISVVLSYDILSYLTYEGVTMSETLALCKDDLKPHLRRMHLVVTAIREFVQAVEIYSKMPSYSYEDKIHLKQLQSDMIEVTELRNLFLLLIRQFRPGVQSKQYLQDLITTNHVLLLLLEQNERKMPEDLDSFHVADFIREFSSPGVIQQYGLLLEDFQCNGEFINDCVFTMMHHVAGDLAKPEALCQPHILKIFSKIWEIEFEIKDDWADLIEFVIQRFMKVKMDEQKIIFKSSTSNQSSEDTEWPNEDIESLCWIYSSCAGLSDPIGPIVDTFKELGSGSGKSRESILNQLHRQRVIGHDDFMHYLSEDYDSGRLLGCGVVSALSTTTTSSERSIMRQKLCLTSGSFQAPTPENGRFDETFSPRNNTTEWNELDLFSMEVSIPVLIRDFITNGDGKEATGNRLDWIQKQVLAACYVKFVMEENGLRNGGRPLLEPVPRHCAQLGHSIPIVPWTKLQEIELISPPFVLLLQKLGFHLAADVGKVFPRMPHFWTSSILLSVANQLGPIPPRCQIKFDSSKIQKQELHVINRNKNYYQVTDGKLENSYLQTPVVACYGFRFHSEAYTDNWTTLVHKAMELFQRQREEPDDLSFAESEHMDDCASLKALPPAPSDISDDVHLFSDGDLDDEEYGIE